MPPEATRLRSQVRVMVFLFIAGLVLSGLTAFPLLHELNLLVRILGTDGALAQGLQVGEAVVTKGSLFVDQAAGT